jgi:hypothetical protein
MSAPNYPKAVAPPIQRLGEINLLWARGNYWQRRLIRKRINHGPPRFFYKYRGFGGKFDEENLRDVIVQSVVRLSAPVEFNDPFDMRCRFIVEGTEQERLARFTSLINEQMPNASPEDKRAGIGNMMAATQQDIEARCQRSIAGIRQTVGVYCFAGSARSVLMWSHYADKHRGVCLQFDTSRDFPMLSRAVPVIPAIGEDLPTVNYIVGFIDQILNMLLSKHEGWQYEKERRIILYGQSRRYLDIRPDSLRSIIFGLHATEESIDFVRGLLADRAAAGFPSVSVLQAHAHPTKYKLVFRRRELGVKPPFFDDPSRIGMAARR